MVPSSMDKLSQNKILSSIWCDNVCMARLRAPIDLQESFRKFFSWGSENMYYFVKISTANITNDTLFSFMNWQNMLVQFCQNCIENITGDCMFSFMNWRNMLLEVIPLIKIINSNITCDKSLSFMNWWNMLLQEIFFIKINPANITLKEITNFQGFLIQKQVHPIFVLLEYCYFHLQKMTW